MSPDFTVLLGTEGAEVELAAAGGGYELRAGRELVARLERSGAKGSGLEARSAEGGWRFAGEGVLRSRVVVTDAATGAEVATIRPRGVSGARGEVVAGGRTLEYRVDGTLTTRWQLLDGDVPLVSVEAVGAGEERYRVALSDPPPDLLLVVIACYGALQSDAAAAASAAI